MHEMLKVHLHVKLNILRRQIFQIFDLFIIFSYSNYYSRQHFFIFIENLWKWVAPTVFESRDGDEDNGASKACFRHLSKTDKHLGAFLAPIITRLWPKDAVLSTKTKTASKPKSMRISKNIWYHDDLKQKTQTTNQDKQEAEDGAAASRH